MRAVWRVVGWLPSGPCSGVQGRHQCHAGSLPAVYGGALPQQPPTCCSAGLQAGVLLSELNPQALMCCS